MRGAASSFCRISIMNRSPTQGWPVPNFRASSRCESFIKHTNGRVPSHCRLPLARGTLRAKFSSILQHSSLDEGYEKSLRLSFDFMLIFLMIIFNCNHGYETLLLLISFMCVYIKYLCFLMEECTYFPSFE